MLAPDGIAADFCPVLSEWGSLTCALWIGGLSHSLLGRGLPGGTCHSRVMWSRSLPNTNEVPRGGSSRPNDKELRCVLEVPCPNCAPLSAEAVLVTGSAARGPPRLAVGFCTPNRGKRAFGPASAQPEKGGPERCCALGPNQKEERLRMTEPANTTQVYRIVIKASAPALWEAITSPTWSERYGYGGR